MKLLLLLIIVNTAWSQTIENQRKKHNLPALGIYLSQDGAELYNNVSGVRSVLSKTPVTKNDTWHLGSCTKTMTATLAALMIERGVLNWNDNISKFFRNTHADYKEVQFQDLFTHRSGIQGNPKGAIFNKLHSFKNSPVKGRAFLTSYMLTKPALFKKGEKWHYSNSAYIIAAHILETLTKKSYETLMQENIFDPLKMKSCGFGINPKGNPRGHIRGADGSIGELHVDNPIVYAPAGAAYCSMKDWALFIQMQSNNFAQRENFLSQSSVKKLTTIQYKDDKYTFGGLTKLERSWAQGFAYHHTGTNTVNYANMWFGPTSNTIMFGVSNIMTGAFKGIDESFGVLWPKNK